MDLDLAGVEALTTRVLAGVFFLAVVFGAVVQRTHFCTMGAISDAVTMGDHNRLRMWALALAVAMAGFAGLALTGRIDPAQTLYASAQWRWLSAMAGGLCFGFGMVLASGCGSKLLVRVGGGNLKSLVTLLVMGLAAFATLKGITAVFRASVLDPVAVAVPAPGDLPTWLAQATGGSRAVLAPVLGFGLAAALAAWALMARDFRRADNLLGGVVVGGVIATLWWLTGSFGAVAEHPETLQATIVGTQSGRAEALSFVAPVAHTIDWLMFFSDKSKVLTTGVVAVLGVIVGSALVSLVTGSFRWESFGGTEDLANHLAGAVFMGFGGVTAMGCTIGQGLSGLSTLSLMSFVSVTAIAGGAVLALRYQSWRLG